MGVGSTLVQSDREDENGQAFGITIPAVVLLQATKVIEGPTRPTAGEQRLGYGAA
jgi:hypothetical protein